MAWAAPQELIAQDDAVVVLGHGVSTRRRLYTRKHSLLCPVGGHQNEGSGAEQNWGRPYYLPAMGGTAQPRYGSLERPDPDIHAYGS
jgi:hypothetical protein